MRRRKTSSKKSPSEWQPSRNTNYVYLSGFVLLPDDVLPLLSHAVSLDYDYVDSKRQWKIKESQAVNVEFWDHDKVNAMRVAQKLES